MRKTYFISLLAVLALSACKSGGGENPSPAPITTTPPVTPPVVPVTPVTYGTTLKADGPGGTYALLNSILGGTAYEVPDCIHLQDHVSEIFDNDLKANVFVFAAHVTPDNDRCEKFDRQRTEIKTYGPSGAGLIQSLGESVTYRWKFKIDAAFQSSSSFTHIHQIKAGDGDDDNPLITLTPRYGANNSDKMELIHINSANATTKVKIVDLAPFKGSWVEVIEKVKYATAGTYSIEIKRISDGQVLMTYENTNIDLWRTGTTFCRPKWGIYRSLNNANQLRDEQIRFADFCIAEGSAVCQ